MTLTEQALELSASLVDSFLVGYIAACAIVVLVIFSRRHGGR